MQGFAQLVLALLGLAIVAFVLYFVGGMFMTPVRRFLAV
jgi:hypothetical protein